MGWLKEGQALKGKIVEDEVAVVAAESDMVVENVESRGCKKKRQPGLPRKDMVLDSGLDGEDEKIKMDVEIVVVLSIAKDTVIDGSSTGHDVPESFGARSQEMDLVDNRKSAFEGSEAAQNGGLDELNSQEAMDVHDNEDMGEGSVERRRSSAEATAFEGLASLSARGMREAIDLEKMTLDEWFEFLEVYLPRQIYEVTEEMLDGMKKKSERLQDFFSEHQNVKRNAEAS